jgi:hypothetical protein
MTEKGLSGDMLELAMVNLEGVLGAEGEKLTPEALEHFQATEALALFEQAGLDPETMGDILEYKDDPEAMREYLAEEGLDDAAIDAFVQGLERSTFAQTVDPENADDFLMGVDDVMVEQESGDTEEVGEDEGTGDEEEVGGDEDTGGEEDTSDEEEVGEDEDTSGEEEVGTDEGTSDDSGGEESSG